MSTWVSDAPRCVTPWPCCRSPCSPGVWVNAAISPRAGARRARGHRRARPRRTRCPSPPASRGRPRPSPCRLSCATPSWPTSAPRPTSRPRRWRPTSAPRRCSTPPAPTAGSRGSWWPRSVGSSPTTARHAGSRLNANGVAKPAILGPRLDGSHETARLRDSDAGLLDGDQRFDRAVGPMQFIPSTWAEVGVDADGDGRRNPQDVDDAALAAAVYLCSGGEDLSTDEGRRSAVHRYNHSDAYVDLVLRVMAAYERSASPAVAFATDAVLAPGFDLAPDRSPGHRHHARPRRHPRPRPAVGARSRPRPRTAQP